MVAAEAAATNLSAESVTARAEMLAVTPVAGLAKTPAVSSVKVSVSESADKIWICTLPMCGYQQGRILNQQASAHVENLGKRKYPTESTAVLAAASAGGMITSGVRNSRERRWNLGVMHATTGVGIPF